MRRVVAITLTLLLITTNLATISDTSFNALRTYPSNLAPSLVFSELPDNTPYRKDIVIGMMTADEKLKLADKLRNIDGVESENEVIRALKALDHESFKKDGPKNVSVVECFYNQLEPVPGTTHIFHFPITITRNNESNKYMFLFSTIRADESSPFPRAMCTLDQLDDIIAKIVKMNTDRTDIFPQYAEKDKKIMARYENEEKGLDKEVIQFAFEGGAIVKSFSPYEGIAKELLKKLNIEIDKNGLTPVEDRDAWLIKTSHTDELWERLKKYGSQVIDKDGNEHFVIPNAHSSNHSIYFFGSMLDRERDLAHEIGVMCGLPALYIKDGRPINKMDERYERYLNGGIEANKPATYKLADLDKNLDTRDFAAGHSTDIPGYAKAAWPWTKPGDELIDPFSKKALAYYAAALPDAERITEYTNDIDAASWYRICYARLFGKNDHEFVLNFFTWLGVAGRLTARGLRSEVLDNEYFIKLYFAALLLDEGSAAKAKDREVNFFNLYFMVMFADAPNREDLIRRYFKIESVGTALTNCAKVMFPYYMKTGQFREAVVVARNMKDLCLNLGMFHKDKLEKITADAKAWSKLIHDAEVSLHSEGLAEKIAAGRFEGRKMQELFTGARAVYELKFIEAVRRVVPAESLAADMKEDGRVESQEPGIPSGLEMFAVKEAAAIAAGIKKSGLPPRGIDRRIALEYFGDLFYDRYDMRPRHLFDAAADPDSDAGKRVSAFINRVFDLSGEVGINVLSEQNIEEALRVLLEKAYGLLPREYLLGPLSCGGLEAELRAAGLIDISGLDNKTALIFSEKVAFGKGLAVLLPKLANAGIKVAVVLSIIPDERSRQENIITELNRKVDGGKPKIEFGERFGDIKEKMSNLGVGRYRYFRVEEDRSDSLVGVDNNGAIDIFDITRIVDMIIDAIGLASHVPAEMLPALHEAAKKLAIAA